MNQTKHFKRFLLVVLQRGLEPRTPCLKGRIKTACYKVVFNIDNRIDNRQSMCYHVIVWGCSWQGFPFCYDGEPERVTDQRRFFRLLFCCALPSAFLLSFFR